MNQAVEFLLPAKMLARRPQTSQRGSGGGSGATGAGGTGADDSTISIELSTALLKKQPLKRHADYV